jgi:hypothetical protein
MFDLTTEICLLGLLGLTTVGTGLSMVRKMKGASRHRLTADRSALPSHR